MKQMKSLILKLGLLAAAGGIVLPALQAADAPWVRINEIRIVQPGTDTDEYFELQGTPGYDLDDVWYLVLGDWPDP